MGQTQASTAAADKDAGTQPPTSEDAVWGARKLAKTNRSLTYYEGQRRVDDRKDASLQAIRSIRKSATFASENLSLAPDLRYEDVLYRRYFNVSENLGRRLSRTASLESAPFLIDALFASLRSSGISVVHLHACTSWPELKQVMDEAGAGWRLVVNPLTTHSIIDSTTFVCDSEAELQAAYGNLVGRAYSEDGQEVCQGVMVYPYSEGQKQYTIDTVTRAGDHRVCAIWEDERRKISTGELVLVSQTLKGANSNPSENFVRLINFVTSALDAVSLREGPAQTHVILSEAGEVSLFALSPACHGSGSVAADVCQECIGYSQASVSDTKLTAADSFQRLPRVPSLVKQGYVRYLVNTHSQLYEGGNVMSWSQDCVDAIKSLPSFLKLYQYVTPGEFVHHASEGVTRLGAVGFASTHDCTSDVHSMEGLEGTPMLVLSRSETVVPCVCIVDPFSTGAVIAADICARGLGCICVYSSSLETLGNLTTFVPAGLTIRFDAVAGYNGGGQQELLSMRDWLRGLNRPILAIIPGAETGVELADALSELMALRTNGTALSTARRNKYFMGERVRSTGVRAVKQKRAELWEEALSFVTEAFHDEIQEGCFKCVCKPMESAGSDDVFLCSSIEEVHKAFHYIMGKNNCLGQSNRAVLVQEYLEGTEYVVDCVSCDGVHKVVAVWEYDRKPNNGRMFVCHGQKLLTADQPHVRELIDYQKKVLDALGIFQGPSHGEVKMSRGTPCLVEVGARCHGAEGAWAVVSDAVYGYNQATSTVDLYVGDERFSALPMEPVQRHKYGAVMFIQSQVQGTLKEVKQQFIDEIRAMPSFVKLEIFPKVGGPINLTIDCLSFGGMLSLVHEDEAILTANYNRVREMESTGLFVVT